MNLNKIALLSVALALMVLTVPFASGCTGWVTGGGQSITSRSTTIPSASFGFNAMWSRDGTPKGELDYVDLITGMHVHIHELDYLTVHDIWQGNKPSEDKIAQFGGPCTVDGVEGYHAWVYVEDHGEPGKDDRFYIEVDTVPFYIGGSKDIPILAGNIQTHKPTG